MRLATNNVIPTYVNAKIVFNLFRCYTTCWTFPSIIFFYFANFPFHSSFLLSKNENKHPERMSFIQKLYVRGLTARGDPNSIFNLVIIIICLYYFELHITSSVSVLVINFTYNFLNISEQYLVCEYFWCVRKSLRFFRL